MDIMNVNNKRVDIYLNGVEVEEIFGGYEFIDYDIPECRIKIHSLIAAAMPKSLLPLDCERAVIEVKAKQSGCVISFTKIYSGIKKYRAKKSKRPVTLFFENSDDLIRGVGTMKRICADKSELYSRGARYAVISYIKQEKPGYIFQLSEYCRISRKEADAAKVREYWNPLCKHGVIAKLYEAFSD